MLSWPPELVSTSLPGSSYGSVFSGNSSAFSQRFSFHATRAGVYNLHLEWACQNGTEFYDGFVDLPVVVMGIEYLGVFDYQFTPSTMGPGLEVISFNGGSVIEVSFDGQSFEWSKELHAGSNFFQTTGWRRFRFVAKEGYVIYTPVQNESNKWIGEGLEFVPTPVYTIFLPLVQN